MKIILDESVPQNLRLLIESGHTVVTAWYQGWSGLKNGGGYLSGWFLRDAPLRPILRLLPLPRHQGLLCGLPSPVDVPALSIQLR